MRPTRDVVGTKLLMNSKHSESAAVVGKPPMKGLGISCF